MADAPQKKEFSPGKIVAVGVCAGLGFALFAILFGIGVEAIGVAKRNFPEVVMGIVAIVLIGAAVASNSKKD